MMKEEMECQAQKEATSVARVQALREKYSNAAHCLIEDEHSGEGGTVVITGDRQRSWQGWCAQYQHGGLQFVKGWLVISTNNLNRV